MGFASEDPLNASLDYSSGSTFISASKSRSLGCQNWDLVKSNRVKYLDKTWNALAEQVSQGKGEHLVALSQMYGCKGEYQLTFESILYVNFHRLFLDMSLIESYESAHMLEDEINLLIQKSAIKERCSTRYTS